MACGGTGVTQSGTEVGNLEMLHAAGLMGYVGESSKHVLEPVNGGV